MLNNLFRRHDLIVRDQRSEVKDTLVETNLIEAGDVRDVDQDLRRSDLAFEFDDQIGAAGDDACA